VELPRWIDLVVLPAFNLALALLASGIVMLIVGHDPLQVVGLLVKGAFGSRLAVSYVLYYATTFVLRSRSATICRPGSCCRRWCWSPRLAGCSGRRCRRRCRRTGAVMS
jgi:hypothetical protein